MADLTPERYCPCNLHCHTESESPCSMDCYAHHGEVIGGEWPSPTVADLTPGSRLALSCAQPAPAPGGARLWEMKA